MFPVMFDDVPFLTHFQAFRFHAFGQDKLLGCVEFLIETANLKPLTKERYEELLVGEDRRELTPGGIADVGPVVELVDGPDQRRLVDQAPAGAVDDANAGLRLGQRRPVDDAPRRVGQRRVKGDEIGAGEKLFQLDFFNAQEVLKIVLLGLSGFVFRVKITGLCCARLPT